MSEKKFLTEAFLADLAAKMKEYYGTQNKPVTFMRAETDLLVRLVTARYALLATHVGRLEKKPEKIVGDDFNIACTDLATLVSIAGKLSDSEKV